LAPAFHLDDENLDPKTWCRFPILSGNYEVEIEALRREANLEPRPRGRSARAASLKGVTQ
jgi:NAD+ synthase (glutamine-hydrolysing)